MVGGKWQGPSGEVGRYITDSNDRTLRSYEAKRELVLEHANIERATAQGGYGHRQLYELIQNGADALLEGDVRGRIVVVLTEDALYCANEGKPVDVDGVSAILSSHVSRKRGAEIGRFGLGFKSVLGVSSRPLFLSRSGSFAFDAQWTAKQVAAVVPGQHRYPVLRLARAIDPQDERRRDPIVAALMEWASTIVKLPLDPGTGSWLADDLARFPAEFTLFSDHVRELILGNQTTARRRHIRVEQQGTDLLLRDGESASRWRVFRTIHRPSAEARRTAGELANRDELPVAWAVPLEGRKERGQFWAFFPTEYQTTLAGILNAPWKTNEDRQNLLTGEFNHELLDACARLVVDSMADLFDPKDPSRHLGVLPARDKVQWADEYLAERIDHAARALPILPDQEGRLRRPNELQLCPPDVPQEALELWAAAPHRPVDWCHHSVVDRLRYPRAERLIGRAASWEAWLRAVVSGPEAPEDSVAALHILGVTLASRALRAHHADELKDTPVALTAEGYYIAPVSDRLFVSEDPLVGAERGTHLVHPDVAADPVALRVLLELGVRRIDADDRLPELLAALKAGGIEDWERFWAAVRRADLRSRAGLHDVKEKLRLRTRSGAWMRINEVLLPGRFAGSDPRDDPITVDDEYHAAELSTLRAVGATSEPVAEFEAAASFSWFTKYLASCRAVYQSAARRRLGSTPQTAHIQFVQEDIAGPLRPLSGLQADARPAFTEALLREQEEEEWTLRHRTQPQYGPMHFPNPLDYHLRGSGWVATSQGPRPVSEALGPAFNAFKDQLPVAEAPDWMAQRLGLPESLDAVSSSQWNQFFRAVAALETLAALGEAYARACTFVEAPTKIRCRRAGTFVLARPADVVVTTHEHLVPLLEQTRSVLWVSDPTAAAALARSWGMRLADEDVASSILRRETGEEYYLADLYPDLAQLVPVHRRDVPIRPCYELHERYVVDGKAHLRDILAHVEENLAYVSLRQGEEEGLLAVLREFGVRVTPGQVANAVRGRLAAEVVVLRQQIAAEFDLARKVVLAIGEDALRGRLPATLHGVSDDLGRLALAVYAVDVLREFRDVLAERGLAPPRSWAGSPAARRFVQELGFPDEYAGFSEPPLEPWLEVLGRPLLPPLHDFQVKIAVGIDGLLSGENGYRGLVALPTGAGKTRVAVESLVSGFVDGRLISPVLWVAQTEELCEQAVQTWQHVWRALGPDQPLTISRLWSTRNAAPVEGHHVVVATIAKLNAVISRGDRRYDWLQSPGGVVIDEAHGSITTSYTELLRWLGYGYGASRTKDRAPLLGLTATPFRGVSREETDRLAGRYDRNRLDHGVFRDDPYVELQKIGVLSRVRHEVLEGVPIRLRPADFQVLEQFKRLPTRVEEQLGQHPGRNDRIIESIRALPDDWTVLVFATSVEHAKILAGLLTLHDISAAPIWGETPTGARRHYIREFRAGRLRVLTNYNVLAEGFDAPAVRAVYVSRPTWSPNRYQQMVGRGLRGPLNGGDEECLIVDVADNVERFGQKLAFRHFDYLWDPDRKWWS